MLLGSGLTRTKPLPLPFPPSLPREGRRCWGDVAPRPARQLRYGDTAACKPPPAAATSSAPGSDGSTHGVCLPGISTSASPAQGDGGRCAAPQRGSSHNSRSPRLPHKAREAIFLPNRSYLTAKERASLAQQRACGGICDKGGYGKGCGAAIANTGFISHAQNGSYTLRGAGGGGGGCEGSLSHRPLRYSWRRESERVAREIELAATDKLHAPSAPGPSQGLCTSADTSRWMAGRDFTRYLMAASRPGPPQPTVLASVPYAPVKGPKGCSRVDRTRDISREIQPAHNPGSLQRTGRGFLPY